MESPEKKYFRLSPGKEVRLRHAFNITCEKVIKNKNGDIIELECSFDPISRNMNKGNKVKGMIHWVDANNCIDAKINIYDRLFKDTKPLSLDSFNKKSLIVKKNAKIENNIDINNYEARYQFERVGYFIRDNKSSNKDLVYNKIVSLKDSWKK
jgi:glutaminyl-tRNA synthetase